ncbi:MAG: 4-(cytidine 5'-diphospho)-2-C-methyl-D-erythritol kinase [Thermodesulfovibrionales bacterium]
MLTLLAPAKINWFLAVRGRRPDGFHEIESLIQRVSLYDALVFEESDRLEVVTQSDIPPLENLVYRAALLLMGRAGGAKAPGVRISLDKKIPIAAGLAGGSSDAAFTLKGLRELWGLGLSDGEMEGLASTLGSDVPFFLNGPAALVSGRGEKVSPVETGNPTALLLIKPPFGVSAGWAYASLGRAGAGEPGPEGFVKALREGDLGALRGLMRNDLEGPVIRKHPEVGELKKRLYAAGALAASMSGSGPTVFGVFETRERAVKAAESFRGLWRAVVETET